MTLIESAPDGDQQHSEATLYHLRRAFSPGDRSYHAQFWYAYELCLVGRYDEAQPIFATFGEAKISNFEKTQIRGVIHDKDGQPRSFTGSIVAVKPSYAFVVSDAPKMRVFVQISDNEAIEQKDLEVGFPVSFNIGFNMRGPTARGLAVGEG